MPNNPQTANITCLRLAIALIEVLCIAGWVGAQSVPAEDAVSAHPELVLQTGHSDDVTALIVHPNGRYVITASRDWSISVWDLRSELVIYRFTGHTGAVTSLALSVDGQRLFSGSTDRTIRMWDLVSRKELQQWSVRVGPVSRLFSVEMRRRGGEILSLANDPLGRYLLAGSASGAWIIDLHSGETQRFGRGGILQLEIDMYSVAFSPDGRYAIGGTWDGAWMWEVETRKLVRHFQRTVKKEGDTTYVNFAAGGDIIVTASENWMKVWRQSDKLPLRTIASEKTKIAAVTTSPTQPILAVSYTNGSTNLWNVHTRSHIGSLVDGLKNCTSLAFTNDGRELLCGSRWGGNGWNIATGNLSRAFLADRDSVGSSPTTFAVTLDGTHVVTGTFRGTLPVMNLRNGQVDQRFRSIKEPVHAIALNESGQRLIAASYDGKLALFDFESGTTIAESHVKTKVEAVALQPDGRTAVLATADGVLVLDIIGGAKRLLKRSWVVGTSWVESVAIDSGSRFLAASFLDAGGGVRLWDTATWQNFTFGGNAITRGTLTGHTGPIRSVAIDAEGEIVVSGSDDNTMRVWDVANRRQHCQFEHPTAVKLVTISPDGRVAASVAGERLYIWRIDPCGPTHSSPGHWSQVTALRFLPSSNLLITLARDRTLRFWDVTTGRERLIYSPISDRIWLTATPNGLFDGPPGVWNTFAWRFNDDIVPAESFLREFYRPKLARDVLSGKDPRAPRILENVDRRLPTVSLSGDIPETQEATRRQTTLTIRVHQDQAVSTRLGGVRLFRNGRLVAGWRDVALDSQGNVTIPVTVQVVSGNNEFLAYAFNHDDVKSRDARYRVVGGASDRRGIAYVVAVGVNDYRNTISPLSYAIADAISFSAELKRQEGALRRSVRGINLIGPQATRSEILRVLKKLAGLEQGPVVIGAEVVETAQPEDAVILFFAMHGRTTADQYVLWPYDVGSAPKENDLGTRSNAISNADVEPLLERMSAGEVLMVIDACESGGLLEMAGPEGPFNATGLAQLAYDKGINIVTASQRYQPAIENSRHGHGLLTYALINEGLQELRADTSPVDQTVTVREWFEFAERRVPELAAEIEKERSAAGASFLALPRGEGAGIQEPRTFYRPDGDLNPLVVATAKTSAR